MSIFIPIFFRGILSISNVYPNETSVGGLIENTQNHLQQIREEYNTMSITVENYDSTSLSKSLYDIKQDFFYNDTKIWFYNISYSTALKLVI